MVHIDHFSFLPDPIIHMIISHLPFKEAARTSILSTRWRRLWHSTTNIDLDETLFVRNQQSSVSRSMQRLNFLNFIDRWMGNYAEPSVDKYRIKISNPTEALRQVQTCISFALNHREIKALDLDFSDPTWDAFNLDLLPHQPSLDLPVILDSHTMLESLHLSACTTFRIPHRDCRFDSLKSLYLGWMEMRGHSINRFVKLCLSLETLIIKRCWGVEDLNIESQSLRFLAIDKCLGLGKITVKKTPLLKYFQYYGLSVSLEMEDMPTMEQAVFDYTHDENWSDGDADMLREILCKISSVWALSICSYVLQVLPLVPSALWLTPSLASVTHLFLKTKLHIQEYYGISLFLNSCPQLELLSIDLGPQPIFEVIIIN
ncbi:hypothetical protein CDL12_11513 [Handroanthus impetiginosus]|uniref:F-box domain-containing protein n=1 Tax=Handroanthus impetiginosus TaxID=429701 RepID=A0A2G9HE82_9LAMI|nr:hypothetical protein CDL12_11513 [Handroanthus impetiginosus]